ncbi:MAG: Ferric iron ABC transporter, iron-binding protein [uncultured Friedmanniella sp.]|uniref:Ferric iron ABC transporter, iron-binding protein n=1 Tax=uncultured Friedmanniella sp. TaxID=335381 RepID=A0A6J4KWI8_9ACTN|nr:iron ABC transporter substrate-binding protein [uncultured Friedmanniella sp.]CAA9317553.1 MAG: Ferric iron ABC transporter, iron-binding protein [uncultured Friedmanniella sp.]
MKVGRLAVAAAAALSLLATACGGSGGGAAAAAEDPDALVVYNAQHESMTSVWAEAFTAETGIKVALRHGKDFELANQIRAEGDRSPAEVFLTENSPAMSLVEQAGMFAPVDPATLKQVPKKYSTSTGAWVGIAARSTVFVYNTKLAPGELPKSLTDLADPQWQGRWGVSPGGADFQAVVSAMLELKGEAATQEWLQAMKTNAKPYQGNNAILQAVNSGEIDGGVIYHYYWYRDQAKTKENSANTKLHFFGNQDPGAFVSVSGGGVLKTAKHADQAQQFLKFITGPSGQQALADSAEYEYTVGSKVPAHPSLKPLSELEPPTVNPSKLNGPKVVEMMTAAGLI